MSDYIQFQSVNNILNRTRGGTRLSLTFDMRVENLAYDKHVDVIWSGDGDTWHTVSAGYCFTRGDGLECWQAKLHIMRAESHPLPRSIRFAIRLRCLGREYWDNNQGNNFLSRAGAGIELAPAVDFHHLEYDGQLHSAQQWVTLKFAVNPRLEAEKVTVHWTTDNWRSRRQTACRQGKSLGQAGVQNWTARLGIADAFRLQYAICCENRHQQIWDNNGGSNYRACRDPLTVLILNLHCYQEEHQDRKFSQIAKAINQLGVDVVCFQEVAEHWNHGLGDWASNSANIINQRLKKPFHLYSDWSHIGFDKYREGVAILSRYPILHQQARYVSDSQDVYDIHSRKVVGARINVPYMGVVNVFSAHLSWWEDGFQQQFQRLCEWANEQGDQSVDATLLCGDFNITAGSIGYRQVVEANQYEDQYLAANHRGLFEKIFRVDDPHWRHYPTDDYRIDYIFMNRNSKLSVTSARVVFTDQDYGRVSDHCGYLMTFEPK